MAAGHLYIGYCDIVYIGAGEGPYCLFYIGPPMASPVARWFVRVCTSLVRTCDLAVRGRCSSRRASQAQRCVVAGPVPPLRRASTVAAGPSGPGGFLFRLRALRVAFAFLLSAESTETVRSKAEPARHICATTSPRCSSALEVKISLEMLRVAFAFASR